MKLIRIGNKKQYGRITLPKPLMEMLNEDGEMPTHMRFSIHKEEGSMYFTVKPEWDGEDTT